MSEQIKKRRQLIWEKSTTQNGDGHHHGVQFYDSIDYLCASVSLFASLGFGNKEGVLLLATAEHRNAIEQRLLSVGVDVTVRKQNGQLVLLDAAETLLKFMVNGSPNRDLFLIVIADVLDRQITKNPRGVRIYGEMVDVLLREGNVSGAIALERLWNELARTRSFSLMCGYAMEGFNTKEHGAAFRDICSEHGQVNPTESFESLRNDLDAQRRLIAQLQQQALALQTEVAHHRATELELRRAESELRKRNKEAPQPDVCSKCCSSMLNRKPLGAQEPSA